MTDQCRHCTYRGDLKKCKSVPCAQHENWYSIEQQKLIYALQNQVEELKINSVNQ